MISEQARARIQVQRHLATGVAGYGVGQVADQMAVRLKERSQTYTERLSTHRVDQKRLADLLCQSRTARGRTEEPSAGHLWNSGLQVLQEPPADCRVSFSEHFNQQGRIVMVA